MSPRATISRLAEKSLLGVPLYGLAAGVCLFLAVLMATFAITSWIDALGTQWSAERAAAATAGAEGIGEADIPLLETLERLIFAGGLMFSLALGALVIAWSRSTRRFAQASRRQRLMRDRSPLFYHEVDHHLKILDVNATECEALGFRREELLGKPLETILVNSPFLLESLEHAEPEEMTFRTQACYRTLQGELLDVLVTVIGDKSDIARPRWIMAAQDITGQTRAQRATARSQIQIRFLSNVVESLEDGLMVLDEQGMVIYANPSAARLTDPEFRGLIGKTLEELFAGPGVEGLWTNILEAARSGDAWQAELGLAEIPPDPLRRSSGEVAVGRLSARASAREERRRKRVLVRLSGEGTRETGGTALILLLRDVTTEKELSRRLESSQQLYQLIFDQAPSGLMVLDASGRAIDANAFYDQRIAPAIDWPGGLSRNMIVEHPALVQAGIAHALERLAAGEEIVLEPVAFPARGGAGTRYLSIRGVPSVDDSAQSARRAFLFIEDITERHELERRREQRAMTLEDEKERAIEESRLKSQFIATVSHELRTPLNAIIGFSQLVARKAQLDERQAANMAKIEDSGRKLLRMVNDLLDISRIEARRMDLHVEPIALHAFLEDLQRQVAPMMRPNSNTLEFDVPRDIGALEADPFRLQQVLMNLLENAAKFTHRGRVKVTARPAPGDMPGDPENIVLTIEDTGVGIPPEKLEHIFDEFYQVDGSATRAYGGTGLGLAIARKLVVLLHGRLAAESQPGVGSTFRVILPRRQTRKLGTEREEESAKGDVRERAGENEAVRR